MGSSYYTADVHMVYRDTLLLSVLPFGVAHILSFLVLSAFSGAGGDIEAKNPSRSGSN